MEDFKKLGNQQLSLCYGVVSKKLEENKDTILENLANILNKVPEIDCTTYTNLEKFHDYCKPYRSSLEYTQKEIFLLLVEQQDTILEEMKKRQRQMLKEIKIEYPSVLVSMIVEDTQGEYFRLFDDMITYVKLVKQGKKDQRPAKKQIYVPTKTANKLNSLGIGLVTTLLKNEGPQLN